MDTTPTPPAAGGPPPRADRLGLAVPLTVLLLAGAGAWALGRGGSNGSCPFTAILGSSSAAQDLGPTAASPERRLAETPADGRGAAAAGPASPLPADPRQDLASSDAWAPPPATGRDAAPDASVPSMVEVAQEKLRRMEERAARGADIDDTRTPPAALDVDGLPVDAAAQPAPADASKPTLAWRDVMPSSGQALTITERTLPFSFRVDRRQTPDGRIQVANLSGARYEARILGATPGSVRINGAVVDVRQPIPLDEHLVIEAPDGTEIFVGPPRPPAIPPGPATGN